MTKIAQNITDLVGKTPLVKINRLVKEDAAELVAKLEFFNPAGSVKDRIALNMIEDAERKGIFNHIQGNPVFDRSGRVEKDRIALNMIEDALAFGIFNHIQGNPEY